MNEAARGIGDNHVDRESLKGLVERIESLETEKAAVGDDIKEVYGEAKGKGYDVKTLRRIVALRKIDKDRRRMEEEMLETYLAALGML